MYHIHTPSVKEHGPNYVVLVTFLLNIDRFSIVSVLPRARPLVVHKTMAHHIQSMLVHDTHISQGGVMTSDALNVWQNV